MSAVAAERAGPVAAVDCGTNSTRLLVVAADGAVLDREMRITRLGEGVDATHVLAPEAVARTVDVLRGYRRVMDELGVVRARVVATSAGRDAVNSADFLTEVERVMGVAPEILDGAEEGALSFTGATAQLPEGSVGPGPVLVVDIGGGSTELVTGDVPPRAADRKVSAVSLDIGCVRLTERFLLHDPPHGGELARARGAVDEVLEAARDSLPPLSIGGLLIGLAGTVSTLAALDGGIAVYERARIHHAVLSRVTVARWLERLAGEDTEARRARPGMDPGRADVIVGGVLILDALMNCFGRDECLVSEDDILDGMAGGLRTSATPRR
jgi:exopolyphosphatase/guanosine-5'-triphosphate,3'-diphosphate pyrophosphatase